MHFNKPLLAMLLDAGLPYEEAEAIADGREALDTAQLDPTHRRKEHERSHAVQGSNFNPNGWGKR